MTPLGKKVRDWLERKLQKYYEGPDPPPRYIEQVATYRNLYPGATVEQWAEFAAELAAQAYCDGYVRGFEWAERDLDSKPKDDPDVLAEQERHAWAQGDDENARAAIAADPLEHLPAEHRMALLRELGLVNEFSLVEASRHKQARDDR